jgi:hypothetical protein
MRLNFQIYFRLWSAVTGSILCIFFNFFIAGVLGERNRNRAGWPTTPSAQASLFIRASNIRAPDNTLSAIA